ncbi:MAG: hypothetical protein IH898_02160 [Planctomycetes bacterium]|nr:hypothetical protein [Planctomycetota bacterium]
MTYQKRQSLYSPTPEEIERKCAEIRLQWSESEREDRTVFVAEELELSVQHKNET